MTEITEPIDFEFHVEVHLKGALADLNVHQKDVEEIAALAEREILAKYGPASTDPVIAHFSTHLRAERPIDALMMGIGLLHPRGLPDGGKASAIEVTGLVVERH